MFQISEGMGWLGFATAVCLVFVIMVHVLSMRQIWYRIAWLLLSLTGIPWLSVFASVVFENPSWQYWIPRLYAVILGLLGIRMLIKAFRAEQAFRLEGGWRCSKCRSANAAINLECHACGKLKS